MWRQTSFKLQQNVKAMNNIAMNKIEPKASPYIKYSHGAARCRYDEIRRNMYCLPTSHCSLCPWYFDEKGTARRKNITSSVGSTDTKVPYKSYYTHKKTPYRKTPK